MPNGFHGTPDEWKRIAAPLERLDSILGEFAVSRDLTLWKNSRNWPERSFRWGNAPERLIQIFLEDQTTLSYTMWISASDDRSRAEYWMQETLSKSVQIGIMERELPKLLARAYEKLTEWAQEYDRAG